MPARIAPETAAAASSPASTSRRSRPRRSGPDRFAVPLLSRPADLVDIDDDNRPAGMDPYLAFGATDADRAWSSISTAAAIEQGALAGSGLEIAWLADKVDAFFIHVQGAARLQMTDGTADARHLCREVRPALHRARAGSSPSSAKSRSNEVTMQSIRAWFRRQSRTASTRSSGRTAPTSSSARRRSTIRRSGPIAAAKVPLTPGRSIAVDRLLHTFGTPFYIDAPSLTAFDGKAVPAADDRAGHRLGDHRAGARRPVRRLGRRGGRDRRRGAQCGGFLCAGAEGAARRRRAMSTRAGKKLSDEDRVLWNLVARTAKPLKGKKPLDRAARQPRRRPDAGAGGAAPARPLRRPPRRRSGSMSRMSLDGPTLDKLPRAGCRSKAASTCTA